MSEDVPQSPERAAAEFARLLDEMIQFPERRAEIEKIVLARFSQPRAVLVLDMSGFSRTTRAYGIVTFLLMIHQSRRLCMPCVDKHGGILVKAEADNLFCLFNSVADALAASREMINRLETANCVLPDDRRLYASVGIGYGETIYVGEEDLFGDEVNLASKLGEDIADKGDILLTTSAFSHVPEERATAAEKHISISGISLPYWQVKS